ncbi:MAG: hypothetical protein LIQ31_09495 [Planctomycetes bacterium]|nr:hypothetical protein [Planctomycetota bacterium]
MTRGGIRVRRMRVWPAIVAPLGLTFIFAVAVWLFASKVASDQEDMTAAALRLESYARLEAREIGDEAGRRLAEFLQQQAEGRSFQERTLRLELKAITDNLYRLLAANLEKSRGKIAARRTVGQFPSGFEGVRHYLELAGTDDRSDPAVDALRACSPELAALLPAGASMAVVRDNFEELLSLGGGAMPENAVTGSMSRSFVWGDGENGRDWTLQVRLSVPDENPAAGPDDIVRHLSESLGNRRLDRAIWRGWLIGTSGQALAYFPTGVTDDAPPFIDQPEEWVDLDGRRLVWLEKRRPQDGDYGVAVSVSIDRPAPPLDMAEELWRDRRWSLTLGFLGALCLFGWIWFGVALLQNRRRLGAGIVEAVGGGTAKPAPAATLPELVKAVKPAAAPSAAPVAAMTNQAERRLVRDKTLDRRLPQAAGLIIANIDDNGVHLEAPDDDSPDDVVVETVLRPPMEIPSGSLFRLQERHRGGKGRTGSRALDQARSRIVQELVKRVRPAAATKSSSRIAATPLATPDESGRTPLKA